MLRSVLAMAALALLVNAAPASAQSIYCTVVGAKQGAFQGDRGGRAGANQIAVRYLTEKLTVPFDTATGRSTGARVHSPVTIVKELDASSPQFLDAAVTNENLPTVTCTFYGARSGGGVSHAYFRIKLTNASIVEYKDAGDGVNGDVPGDEHEVISFTYQKLEMTDLDGGITTIDEWFAAG